LSPVGGLCGGESFRSVSLVTLRRATCFFRPRFVFEVGFALSFLEGAAFGSH